jgi:hypothetical protein
VSGEGDLDYALARIAAIRSRRPGPAAWRGLASLRGFGAVLAAARSAGFGASVDDIDATTPPHAVERALRAAWRRENAEFARWMPARWRPALSACGAWWDLPRLRGGEASDDDDAPLAALRAMLPAGHPTPGAAWQALLLERLRAAGADRDPAFARLGRMLGRHRAQFLALAPGNGWPLRDELESALLGFMHTSPPGPATAFAWVALRALDHERLRGALLPRAVRDAAA